MLFLWIAFGWPNLSQFQNTAARIAYGDAHLLGDAKCLPSDFILRQQFFLAFAGFALAAHAPRPKWQSRMSAGHSLNAVCSLLRS
jgi:hypothetical protein